MIRASIKKIRKTRQPAGTTPTKFTPQYLGRKRSILLDGDDASQNVVINKDLLKHHKNFGAVPQAKTDGQVAMSDDEFSWWSNPFYHLIRVTATLLPLPETPVSPSTPAYITPTKLHHSRYAARPEGTGAYFACSRKAIPLVSGKGRHRGTFPGAEIHSLLENQITSGLEARCAEEAELLATRIRSSPIQDGAPLGLAVRRLTTAEHEVVLKEGNISDPSVSAVLVVPKLGESLEYSPTQTTGFLLRGPSLPTADQPSPSPKLPVPRIPIFFGSSLIHDSSLLARLRKALDQALSAERKALQRARPRVPEIQAFTNLPYETKAKDA
ncbi:hypothetical protein FRC07_000385, partial [Ceratobasidium sp. 392]